ncbi:hypothetical protein I4U23_021585 [Adineta vaga]|nr:hypothetical protein I4U23_021585 [Adineta vaga]
MASYNFNIYFGNRFTTFFIDHSLLYKDLVLCIETIFNINIKYFILQIYDERFQTYVEFDDEFINWLRQRLPRTSVATIFGRMIPKRNRTKHQVQPSISLPSTNFNQLKHQIVWLDKYIGIPENHRLLKQQFHNITSIDTTYFTDDIDLSICDEQTLFETAKMSYFKVFEDIEICLEFINRTGFRPVTILITSNDVGSHIVPLLNHLEHVFIYILRNDWYQFQWGLDYLDRLQMFDHDQTLLIRITRIWR